MTGEPILSVRDLTVQFDSGDGWRSVVENVSFTLNKGEVLGIVGESGSGKTVTSRALIRLLPDRVSRIAGGSVDFEGRDVIAMSESALEDIRGGKIGMIFQNPTTHLDPVMRIGQQIAAGLMLHLGLRSRAARARTIELLDEVGFRDPERQVDAFPHELSGGMRQRAMIAGALSCNPAILIADEPTTALDVTVQAQIIELLRTLGRQRGLSIIFISHDLGLVADFCQRMVVMERGRIVEAGAVDEVIARPQHPYTIRLLHSQPGLTAPGRYFDLDGETKSQIETQPAPQGDTTYLAIDRLAVAFSRKRSLGEILTRKPVRDLAAVDGVSLNLTRGEALGLVGESGSGKSTLARSVVGLVTPKSGEIQLNGKSLGKPGERQRGPWHRQIQMIFQDPVSSLNPKMTVGETLAEPLAVHRLCPPADVKDRVLGLMTEVGLEHDLLNRKPHQLSGGQCQRVGIARALSVEPEFLIADEPTSALDVTIQAQIINLLMRLRESRGLTMLFISHDLTVVRHLCQRIAVMQHGRLVETGSAEEIFDNPRQDYTRKLLAAIPRVARAR
ncbi:MAG: ABC transporter ATP-binding protein [Bauldia litoralis]